MNLLAIIGSPRKGKATDTLVDKAIEGIKSKFPNCKVKKINLIEHDIKICKNCLACRDSKSSDPMAKCSIRNDMDYLKEDILNSDTLIFATTVHMGYATAVMMTFFERICWTFGKPERRVFTIRGCPFPRSDKTRETIIIVTSGIIPPMYRKVCDWASNQIKGVVEDSLNGEIVGDMYAGDIEHRGIKHYFPKAFNLGKRLA